MNTSTSVTPQRLSETDFFSFITNYALDNNLSIAFWRLPNQTIKHVLLARQHQYLEKGFSLEELPTGFLFAPFDREKESIFLPADFSFKYDHDDLVPGTSPKEVQSLNWLNEVFKKSNSNHQKINYNHAEPTESEKANYIDLVKEALTEIEKGVFEKIVLSRTKLIELPNDFNVVDAFQKLCNAYPQAMISFVSLPGIGSWFSATPEVLVSIKDKTIFKTVALAGTKPSNETINLKTVAWTQKEIEEQALVERYIISCFKKIRLREYDEQGPKTVIAGNLMHLKSEFTVDMKATNFPQLGSTMLQLLHPTSAVCGVPLEPSLEFLKKHEGYDREFYSGYLGPVNVADNTNIFVNLRCMQLLDNKAICYAGAGITVDSDAEEEWNETELKLNTILSVLNMKL